jgi:hypothetical protein
MTYSAAAPVLVSGSARDVDAGGVRQPNRDRALHDTGADVALDRVERRRRHPDPDLADARDRLVHVLVAQDLGGAVLVETHCLHDDPHPSESVVLRT